MVSTLAEETEVIYFRKTFGLLSFCLSCSRPLDGERGVTVLIDTLPEDYCLPCFDSLFFWDR